MNWKSTCTPRGLLLVAMIGSILVFGALHTSAEPLFQHGSPQVRTLRQLYSNENRVFPIDSYPVSRRVLQTHADRLLGRTDSAETADRLRDFIDSLSLESDRIFISADFSADLRGTTHDPEEDVEHDFARAYSANAPWLTTHLYLETPSDIILSIRDERQRRFTKLGHTNVPLWVDGVPLTPENNSIREGYVWTTLGPMEITFGRHDIETGPSPFSSFAVNPDVPFLDAVRVYAQIGPLTMTYFASTLENREAVPDVELSDPGEQYDFERNTILFNLHYFSYDFGRVRAGIGSHVVIARKMNQFHLADFFPVASWHNQNLVPNNHALIADVSVSLLPGLELYTTGGLDDVDGNQIGINDDDIPTIYAGTLGGTGFVHTPVGRLHAAAEAGLTHYLWGNFDDGDELGRAIYRMDTIGDRRMMPLTGRYGPGVRWFAASADIRPLEWLELAYSLEVVNRNREANLFIDYRKDDDIMHASRSTAVYTSLDIRLLPTDWMRISLQPQLRLHDGSPTPVFSGELRLARLFRTSVE